MIVDSIENWKNYHFGPAFAKAFEFLESVGSNTADGKYEIDGDRIYAMVQSVQTEGQEVNKLELHRKYIDIQYIFDGTEVLAWLGEAKKQGAKVEKEYDETKDAEFIEAPDNRECSCLEMHPGMFAVFFPQDAHWGKIEALSGSESVSKVVVKVAADLF